jgi:asparagine synthase (glutamine-hydrolysing)
MGEEWFAVLPDSDAALTAARALRPLASRVVRHASGRSWLMGHWPEGAMTVAAAGAARVAVAGDCQTAAPSLRDPLRSSMRASTARVRSVLDADRTVAGLPGCFHLIASIDGRVRVQGSLSSVRRVVRARVGNAVIAADSARVLAELTGAGWDPAWLALRLSSTTTPFPLHESTPWRGVNAVPSDHWLSLEPDGGAVERLRWSPPEPELPLAEGAKKLREALGAAVRARTAQGGTVSTDMSGGMDSTSLAFLAAEGPVALVTYRWSGHDPGDDSHYAHRAATALPHALHTVDPYEDMTPMFAGLSPEGPPADQEEPFPWVRNMGRIAHVARVMGAAGSRTHLTGHGGDELFGPGPVYLHDLLRTAPRAALPRLRTTRTTHRWRLTALLGALAEHRSPARELAAHAANLRKPPPGPRDVAFGWSPPPRMPAWATADAAEAARALLLHTAEGDVRPLAPQRAQHNVLLLARSNAPAIRQAERISAAAGPRFAVPYLDDQVLDAVLSVRLADRCSPWSFKPLLTTAMRETVPGLLLDRTTKGEFNADFFEGLRRQRNQLLELFDQSELARHGLIDTTAVHRILLRPHTDAAGLTQLDATLACEMWLRSLSRSPVNGGSLNGGSLNGGSPNGGSLNGGSPNGRSPNGGPPGNGTAGDPDNGGPNSSPSGGPSSSRAVPGPHSGGGTAPDSFPTRPHSNGDAPHPNGEAPHPP